MKIGNLKECKDNLTLTIRICCYEGAKPVEVKKKARIIGFTHRPAFHSYNGEAIASDNALLSGRYSQIIIECDGKTYTRYMCSSFVGENGMYVFKDKTGAQAILSD